MIVGNIYRVIIQETVQLPYFFVLDGLTYKQERFTVKVQLVRCYKMLGGYGV